jgi:L-gulonolactone oxidase
MKKMTNWSAQYNCRPTSFTAAKNMSDIQLAIEQAQQSNKRLRVFGSGYSPSDIAMSEEHLLNLSHLNSIINICKDSQLIEVEAGITLRELDLALKQYNLALPYHASVSEQTVAGAMATATHGTGSNFGVMPTWIKELDLVTASGKILTVNKDNDLFPAACCSLGSLGVHSRFKLNVCSAFHIYSEENRISPEQLFNKLSERLESTDHYRLWYLPHAKVFWEWRGWRCNGLATKAKTMNWNQRLKLWLSNSLIGYHGYQFLLWLSLQSPSLLPYVNRGIANYFFKTDKHSSGTGLDQFTFDCKFSQYHNEWSIPLPYTKEAMIKLIHLVDSASFPTHLPIEFRFMKKDNIWLSPNQGRDGCHIGVIAYRPYNKDIPYHEYFNQYEAIMSEYSGRPHWAKKFNLNANKLKIIYPHWEDFHRVRKQLDPNGLFGNSYTDRVFGSEKK